MPDRLLSERDHEWLKRLFTQWSQGFINTRNRTKDNHIDNEEWLAPEVYIARTPTNGIPGLLINTTGSGSVALSDDKPGSAECSFYTIQLDSSALPRITPLVDFTQTVYNITTTTINGNSWVLAIRDKAGNWIADPLGPTATTNAPGCRYIKIVDKICFVTITYSTTGSGSAGGSCIGPVNFGYAGDLSDGDSIWLIPDGVLTAGVDVATNTLPAGGTTDSLFMYGTSGVSFPPTAFLTGVIIEALIDTVPDTPSITIYCILWNVQTGLTLGTAKTITPPFASGYITLGSATDLWGNTTFQWTTYHGCLFYAVSADGSDVDIAIDHVRFTICYPQGTVTPTTGGTVSRQAIQTQYQLIDLTKDCGDPDRIVQQWCEIDEEGCCDVTPPSDLPDTIDPGMTGCIPFISANYTVAFSCPDVACLNGKVFTLTQGGIFWTGSLAPYDCPSNYYASQTNNDLELRCIIGNTPTFRVSLNCIFGTDISVTPFYFNLIGATVSPFVLVYEAAWYFPINPSSCLTGTPFRVVAVITEP